MLSFLKDTHKTCSGVVMGHWFLTWEVFCILMERNRKVKTRLYCDLWRVVIGGTCRELACRFNVTHDLATGFQNLF